MSVEIIGYIGRVISSRQSPDWTLTPYIMQSLLLLLGPALFAASIYMILARIIRLVDGEKHSIIKIKWLTVIFVTGDVLSFFVQSGGMF
jgi:RTA1 like protein